MKSFKIILAGIFATLALVSCSSDDNDIIAVEPKKIDSVHYDLDTMSVHTMQPIKVFSKYVNGCEGFFGMDYIAKDSLRTVVNFAFKTNEVCQSTSSTKYNLIRFEPRETGVYYFRFWTGKQGENDTWLEKQIVVE